MAGGHQGKTAKKNLQRARRPVADLLPILR
jgi:hypothetical protein